MASTTRRKSAKAYSFYSTALILSAFALYSILRSVDVRNEQGRGRLASRALHVKQKECRFVHDAPNQCAYVLANCEDEDAGLIKYLQFYYCTMSNAKPAALVILIIWISLLFSTIGIAASDFLCINLSTMAEILGMSESLTGVTFLAFGNGSPDVFSTFAAMSSNSGSLAVGELVGAAGFITAVVAGSMALVKPFNVARRSFIRDVSFFTVAASFSMVFLIDGSLRLWECAAMVGFYVFYVIFVVFWHWYRSKHRARKQQEREARLQHHIPHTQELEVSEHLLDNDDEESRPVSERRSNTRTSSMSVVPILSVETPAWKLEELDDDNEVRDRYLAELQSNMRITRAGRGERRNTMTPIRPSLIGALEFRSVLNHLERKSTQASNISLRRYSDEGTSAIGQSQPSASQPELTITPSEPRANGSIARGRAVSATEVENLRLDTNLLELDTTGNIPETAIYSAGPSPMPTVEEDRESRGSHDSETSPQLFLSPMVSTPEPYSGHDSYRSINDRLAPPTSYFHRPDYHHDTDPKAVSPLLSPTAGAVPTLKIPQPHQHPHTDHKHSPLSQSFPPYVDSPSVLTPSSSRTASVRAPSLRLPAPSLSPESTAPRLYDEEELRTFKWWPYAYLPAPQTIFATLFPTLYCWSEKGWLDKVLGIVTTPSVFLLTITLPIVETDSDDSVDPDPGLLSPELHARAHSISHVHNQSDRHSFTDTPGAHPHRQNSVKTPQNNDHHDLPSPGPKSWNRWLVFLQVFTAPLFIVFIIWANITDFHDAHLLVLLTLGSLIFSLVCTLIILATTSSDRVPRYRPLLCFLGFAVAISWISTIADEVVGVLKTLGVVLNISDAILGLTIFAVGNSIGDLVADITVARLGYPVMALSACFGG